MNCNDTVLVVTVRFHCVKKGVHAGSVITKNIKVMGEGDPRIRVLDAIFGVVDRRRFLLRPSSALTEICHRFTCRFNYGKMTNSGTV